MKKKMIWLGSLLGVFALGLFLGFVFLQQDRTEENAQKAKVPNWDAKPGYTKEQVAYWDALTGHEIKLVVRTKTLYETMYGEDISDLEVEIDDLLTLLQEAEQITYPPEYASLHQEYVKVMGMYEEMIILLNDYLYEVPEAVAKGEEYFLQLGVDADEAYTAFVRKQNETYYKSGNDINDNQ